MSAPALLDTLAARGVALDLDGDRLRVDAPAGELSDSDRAAIRANKGALIALVALRAAASERDFAAGAAYDPAAAKVEAERSYTAGEITLAQRNTLLAFARQAAGEAGRATCNW